MVSRTFDYQHDNMEYSATYDPHTEKYVIRIFPGTNKEKVIGSAWNRKLVSGFAGKLDVDLLSYQREIICNSLKDLVWWLHMEYKHYLEEVAQ